MPAHPCRALGLTPERCEAEVLLAVCIVAVVGGHGRVATAHQIAPWRSLSKTFTCCERRCVASVPVRFRRTPPDCADLEKSCPQVFGRVNHP